MKTNRIIWSFYTIIMIVFLGCQKEVTEKSTIVESNPQFKSGYPILSGIEVIDGRLYFENQSEFAVALQTLFNNQNNLDGFEEQFRGFNSSRMAFDLVNEQMVESLNGNISTLSNYAILLNKNGDTCLEPVIDRLVLSVLFNDEGVLQIGQKIWKETYYYFYEMDLETFKQNRNSFQRGSIPGLNVYPIERKTTNTNMDSEITSCTNNYATKKRMRGELNQFRSPVYNDITVETKNRKKGFLGIWYSLKADEIHLDGTGTYNWMPVPELSTFSVNETKYNKADIQEIVDFSAGIVSNVYPYFVTSNSTHYVKVPQQKTCNIIY